MWNRTLGVQLRLHVQQDSGCAMEDGRATGHWVCNTTEVCNGGWMDVQHDQDVQQDFGCAMEDGRATGHWVCN